MGSHYTKIHPNKPVSPPPSKLYKPKRRKLISHKNPPKKR